MMAAVIKELMFLLQMYAEGNDVTPDRFRELLLQAYKLAMDHYSGGPHTCAQLSNILKAVIESAVSLFYVSTRVQGRKEAVVYRNTVNKMSCSSML
jgi:hypothetical protein